jgi:AcrR family transcriptional regulator
VQEICRLARANIAAVNYHFRSKEMLYAEAWRVAFRRSLARYPADGGVDGRASAPLRLRGRILSLMHRIADPGNCEFEIVYKEMANPTGLLNEVVRTAIQPLRNDMQALVADLLGPGAGAEQVQLCLMSILAQCFDLMMRERHRNKLPDQASPFAGAECDLETVADHVTEFSLAGIRDLRRRNGRTGRSLGVRP